MRGGTDPVKKQNQHPFLITNTLPEILSSRFIAILSAVILFIKIFHITKEDFHVKRTKDVKSSITNMAHVSKYKKERNEWKI